MMRKGYHHNEGLDSLRYIKNQIIKRHANERGKEEKRKVGGGPWLLDYFSFFILVQNFGQIDEGTSTTTYFLPHISRVYLCTTKLKIKETMQKMKIPKNTLKFKHPKKQKKRSLLWHVWDPTPEIKRCKHCLQGIISYCSEIHSAIRID
jgi:hypothetical protein